MHTVRELSHLRELVRQARTEGKIIGFVPTMGALHEGHLSLVRRAREECGFVVVSIFVNPLQFAPHEDFRRYPRTPEKDSAMLEREGADLLYSPEPSAFYPPGFATAVEVSGVSERGEGEVRPGHFRGVATVVAKLFLQVSPDRAYFGQKDLQQTAVIGRLIADLDFPITLVIGETIREPDGLAMSSRNIYLTPDQRRVAVELPRALWAARERIESGEQDIAGILRETRERLEAFGLAVDYVEAVHADTIRPAQTGDAGTALTAAVRVGGTRLIDNVALREADGSDRRRA